MTDELKTTPRLVALDAAARAQAAELVGHVQLAHDRASEAGHVGQRAVDVAYVFTGAIEVGLNHWTRPDGTGLVRSIPPLPHAFVARAGEGVEMLATEVAGADMARAEKLAVAMGVDAGAVLSAAACTGLATMLGIREMRGPWLVGEV